MATDELISMIELVIKISNDYFRQYTGFESIVWHGMLINLLESIFLGVFYFLPIYFINELNFSIINAGIIISFFGFGTIFGGSLGGILSDHYTSEKICIISLLLQSIVFFVLTKIKLMLPVCIIIFLMGLFSYTFLTSNHLWVLQRSGVYKLKALNILNVVSNLGLAISAIIIGFVIDYGFQNIFFTASFFLFMMSVYFLLIQSLSKSNTVLDTTSIKNVDNNLSVGKKNHLKITIVLFCTLLMGFIIFQTNTTYAQFLLEKFPSMGAKSLSILFTINSIMVVCLQTPFVGIFSESNRLITLGMGALLIGLGMVILNFSYLFIIVIGSCVIYTIGEMLFCPISQLICYDTGSESKGFTMGLYRTVYASSRVAAPTLGTFIFQYFGSEFLWFFCGFLGLCCLSVCLAFKKI